MVHYIVKVCYAVWTYFWICSSCWDTFPWIRYHFWSSHHWASYDNSLVMDGSESPWDSWGALRLPFSMEPLKLHSIVWGVSVKFLVLHLTPAIWFILLLCLLNLAWSLSELISMTIITVCCTQSRGTTHQLLHTWTGKYWTFSV